MINQPDIPSDKQPRLYALDAMRGVCAIALMLYHYYFWNGADYFQIGYFGVYVFFILSGFSLWYVYARRPASLDTLQDFFVARVARIVPLYVAVCLLATAARLWAQGAANVMHAGFYERFLFNVTLLFGFAMPGKTSIVPGGWSIGIEWVFYLAFPLFFIFARRIAAMLGLLVAALILNQVICYAVTADSTITVQWAYYTNFPTFLVYFIAGIATAMLYDRLQFLKAQGKTLPFPDSAWLCRMVPFFAIAVLFLYPAGSPEEYLKGCHVVLLVGVAMMGVLAGAFAKPGAWEKKLYRFLGDISYSTYLLNFFVYYAAEGVLKRAYPTHPIALTIALASIGTIAAAYLSYRFFEMPARKWINKKLA